MVIVSADNNIFVAQCGVAAFQIANNIVRFDIDSYQIDLQIRLVVLYFGRIACLHVILFTSVGRTDVIRTFNIKDNSPIDLGTLYISDNVTQLGNVEVVAQKPLVKMTVDKMSYSVSDDVDAKTNTVLDMLRKVPMVTVDGSDNITVNGSSSFKVFVDGKPSVMMSSNPSQIFKNMPASSVQNIEVVTNPGAKYDAEGVGGVLNLIMFLLLRTSIVSPTEG